MESDQMGSQVSSGAHEQKCYSPNAEVLPRVNSPKPPEPSEPSGCGAETHSEITVVGIASEGHGAHFWRDADLPARPPRINA
jgi:hypothetical protein